MAVSETLRSVIDAGRSSKRLDELSSARVIGKIALLAHAAQQKAGSGKSIGPITPAHITLLPSGEVTLEATASGSPLGYSAPEQISGGSGDRRSDVFSLGAVLWEVLTHTRLFDAMNDAAVKAAVAEREITAPADVNANIPAELSAICMRALSRNPADRYSSLKSMAVEIEEFLEEAGYSDDDSRIAQFLTSMNLPVVAKPSPMAPVVEPPPPEPTQPMPTIATTKPAAAAPMAAAPAPAAAPTPVVAALVPATTAPITQSPPATSPAGTKPPPMGQPTSSTQPPPMSVTAFSKPSSTTPPPTAASPTSPPTNSATSLPSILTDPPSEPSRAKRPSGIEVANALASAASTTTALGVPAAPAPADWQDNAAPSHAPMPTPLTPMAPVLPGQSANASVGKATMAASVPPQVKVATTIDARHADPRQTLIGTPVDPKAIAKPASDAVAGKAVDAPLEAKPAEAKAAAPADDTRATLVDEKLPAAVVAATAAGRPARAGSKSEAGGKPARARSKSEAGDKATNPVDAVSLPGRESKADLLSGWGWGTGKHDALPPANYTDDDDIYEQPNNRKPLVYAIGGGLGIALLVTIIAFAAGGSKSKKKPQNAKATATESTAGNTTARAETPTPVEAQPTPIETPPPPSGGSGSAAVDPEAEKAAAEKALADKAAADKAAAEKAEAETQELAKQDAARSEAEKKELAQQDAARSETEKKELAKQEKLAKQEAAKAAKAEAAAKAEQARLAKQDAAKADAEKKRLAREEAAKAEAEKKRLAREEAAKRPKTDTTKTVAKDPKTEPRKAEPKTVAKAEPKTDAKVDVETAYRIGLQQFARGDTNGALASLRTSLAGNPNYAPTWRGLGLVFEKMGEKAQAKNAYKRYLQLAPTAGDAEIIRGRLERLGT